MQEFSTFFLSFRQKTKNKKKRLNRETLHSSCLHREIVSEEIERLRKERWKIALKESQILYWKRLEKNSREESEEWNGALGEERVIPGRYVIVRGLQRGRRSNDKIIGVNIVPVEGENVRPSHGSGRAAYRAECAEYRWCSVLITPPLYIPASVLAY